MKEAIKDITDNAFIYAESLSEIIEESRCADCTPDKNCYGRDFCRVILLSNLLDSLNQLDD